MRILSIPMQKYSLFKKQRLHSAGMKALVLLLLRFDCAWDDWREHEALRRGHTRNGHQS